MKRYLLIILLLLTAADRSNAQTGRLEIRFQHRVGKSILQTDSNYMTHSGEVFSINKFRYYVSGFLLQTVPAKKTIVSNNHYLVNENEVASKKIVLQLPIGAYSQLGFLLGVDSLHNVSGSQSGALDPLNDMFWTWNTGYVMAKLEGRSPLSRLPHRMIEYHIGGFRGRHAVLQNIQLTSPGRKPIFIKNNKTTILVIDADLLQWFSGKHNLKIADHPACTSPGSLALQYAENYATMFSIQSVTKP